MSLEKHRDESETFSVDFVNRLGSVETISSVQLIRVHDVENIDVTSQFGWPIAGAISGTKAQFTLADAQVSTDQLKGVYYIYCEILTSESEKLVETPKLTISSIASST